MVLPAAYVSRARTATQLIFLVCGLGMSSWAPMIPLAKDRLALNDANLGLLLLLLGGGSMLMMPISGWLVNRFGSRLVMACAALVMALVLPLLLILSSTTAMAVTLFIFGSSIGTIDVAMNAHGVQVQNLFGRPIMSSLHGLFSVGGLFGSLGLGSLMKLGLNPVYAIVSIAVLMILITLTQYKKLFPLELEQQAIAKFSASDERPATVNRRFNWMHSSVLYLGLLCFAIFLAEGAILDWSAIFLRDIKGVTAEFAGAGYAAFSIAMATMRLAGDKLVASLTSKIVVVGGSVLGAVGLSLAVLSPWVVGAMLGFVLLGLGVANIVPVFFSEAGRLPGIPPTTSLPAITTIGYTGLLTGPALLGFIAHHFSLSIAFGFIILLLVVVAVSYGIKGAAN
ncbi:MFS transporter [Spirosoma sp. KCTC 42546]|nr:MFS transporter [Spirosoma sp. KCTC 42546]QDK80525.1 MFS transporter [Spirosoma sp. KCTC 42546]